jgi:hypothetical protein
VKRSVNSIQRSEIRRSESKSPTSTINRSNSSSKGERTKKSVRNRTRNKANRKSDKASETETEEFVEIDGQETTVTRAYSNSPTRRSYDNLDSSPEVERNRRIIVTMNNQNEVKEDIPKLYQIILSYLQIIL